jgi:hypothetical protein
MLRVGGVRSKAFLFAFGSAIVGLVLGLTYIPRLPNHRGYALVAFEDVVRAPRPVPPRHTVLVVIDGLREDAARTMETARDLARRGQCRSSDQGDYTVSRPNYALLSTGLEVDRHGARNNENEQPLAAESVWDVARESGMTVALSSHLPWFAQLFPRGFSHQNILKDHRADVFAVSELADVEVIHPLYVDDAGHHYGAASKEYALAVARADREIRTLLDRIDFERDVVVLTADHGHREEGGHGGGQAGIRNVLLCAAGPHVRHADGGAIDGRATGPLLAMLLGLRFPRHMRAGEDGLDTLFEIVDGDPAFLADRREAVARARETNVRAIEGWIGAPGTWSRFAAHERTKQWLRAMLVGALAIAALWKLRPSAWPLVIAALTWLAHRAVLGPFDYTIVNLLARFVPKAFAVVILAMVASFLVRRFVRPRETDVDAWLAALLFANVGHVFVYGWPLGYPLPPAEARYFPFFGAIALCAWGLVTAAARLGRPSFRRR